jgi:hypothetical protein
VDEVSKACGTHEKKNASSALLCQPERKTKKRPLGRTTRRWEYVIKMDLKGIRW